MTHLRNASGIWGTQEVLKKNSCKSKTVILLSIRFKGGNKELGKNLGNIEFGRNLGKTE